MLSPQFIERLWYGNHVLSWALLPPSWCYTAFTLLRRAAYAAGLFAVQRVSVPVIVVGNLTVGGTGKTPLIIWLADYLKNAGFHPGIVSRGYGGTARRWPQQVRPDTNPRVVGDEPVLISRRTGCPVAVAPNRYIAARELIEHTGCDLILCDDGLQHHELARDLEIAVIDGRRGFGNGRCLPAGPLREPVDRLRTIDMVVGNGRAGKNQFLMEYEPLPLQSVNPERGERRELSAFAGQTVHAVAGTGNPEGFFSLLRTARLNIVRHAFPDHYYYRPGDLDFGDGAPVVMTEKDAVKCEGFALPDLWYLPIRTKMSNAFEHRLSILMQELRSG
jgi:tetraacyldisaccharide 4'-kinase